MPGAYKDDNDDIDDKYDVDDDVDDDHEGAWSNQLIYIRCFFLKFINHGIRKMAIFNEE